MNRELIDQLTSSLKTVVIEFTRENKQAQTTARKKQREEADRLAEEEAGRQMAEEEASAQANNGRGAIATYA